MKSTLKVVLIGLLTVVCCVAESPAQTQPKTTLGRLSDDFERIAEKVNPAVVRVIVSGYTSAGPGSPNILSKERNTGSGVILDPNGYIVTNAHVVDGAKRIQVVLALTERQKQQRQSVLKPRGEMAGAQLVGLDRETDLAVLKIEERDLPVLELSDSEQVRKGQIVLAFGSPLGLENSVSMGVVSSVARQLRSEDPMIYIQTDAPINPGSSGGPLVNTQGQVIGINTLIFSQSGGNEGIGFAAPSNIVENVYQQIRTTGRVKRGIIGVHAQTITPLMAQALDLPQQAYVIIGDVKPYSPADKAGLRIGDVILKLDGKLMENGRQFDVNLYSLAVGDHVILDILRGRVEKAVKVAIVERPNDPDRFSELVTPEKNLIPKLDMLALDVDDTIAKMLPPLRLKSGVVVANRPNLFYETEPFQPGDVIHALNGQPIASLDDLRNIVETLSVYEPVVVQVERRSGFRFITFEVE